MQSAYNQMAHNTPIPFTPTSNLSSAVPCSAKTSVALIKYKQYYVWNTMSTKQQTNT